jgi:signal transduction histidine kinase
MREQIADSVNHLAASVGQLKAVSKALTTTTGGVEELNHAVVRAAQAIAGEGSVALVVGKDEPTLATWEAQIPPDRVGESMIFMPITSPATGDLASPVGGRVRAMFPMDYKGTRVGMLVVDSLRDLTEADAQALSALANNAAVAVENARLFEQEKETVARLREVDRIKSDFLTTAQHELRTPILAIMGQLDLIRVGWEQWEDPMKLDMIRDIDASTRQMDGLVATMVDYTLLTSDSARLKRSTVDIQPTLEAVLTDLAAERREGIAVKVRYDIEPGAAVDADRQRFRQMLRAILDNCVKFTPPGGMVEIRCRVSDGLCRLSFADTGVGIGREALEKVFEPLFQEDNSRTPKFGGMGMGLALAKKICDLHGAEIQVTSTEAAGTTVHVRWAVATADTPVPAAASGFHISV